MSKWEKMPSSEEECIERANDLKEFLEKNIGGTWETRHHNNFGWHYSCYCGTISIHEHPASYSSGSIHVMNGSYGVGFGGDSLSSYSVRERSDIKDVIQKTLAEQKESLEKRLDWYKKNYELPGFLAIEVFF